MSITTVKGTRPIQRIVGRHGAQVERSIPYRDPSASCDRTRTSADQVPLTLIMSRDTVCARRDLEATRLVELMAQSRVGCVPVVEESGRPIGMVTKLDLVERLFAAEGGEIAPVYFADTASDLMMPLAITLAEHATVAHAAAVMAREAIHHVPIVDLDGCLIGIVSSMDIVCWLANNNETNTRLT